MASTHDALFERCCAPLHSRQFGDTIAHRPSGVASSAVNITAEFWVEASNEDSQGGRHVSHRGVIRVADTLTVTDDDTWEVNDQLWITKEIGIALQDGRRDITVERITPNLRSGARERI